MSLIQPDRHFFHRRGHKCRRVTRAPRLDGRPATHPRGHQCRRVTRRDVSGRQEAGVRQREAGGRSARLGTVQPALLDWRQSGVHRAAAGKHGHSGGRSPSRGRDGSPAFLAHDFLGGPQPEWRANPALEPLLIIGHFEASTSSFDAASRALVEASGACHSWRRMAAQA